MIVIEGCDGTGKTTLAKNLASLLRLEYVHELTPNGKDNFEYYLQRALELPRESVVDRFHLGEYVYPLLKKDGRVPLESWQQHVIERVLLAKGTVLIHARPVDTQRIRDVVHERGDDYVTVDEVTEISALFREAVSNTVLPVYRWDYSHPDQRVLADLVFRHQVVTQASKALEESSGLGDRSSADWILVGDRFADDTDAQAGKLAFTASNNSSRWLHQALEHVDGEGYITNAYKFEDEAANIQAMQQELRHFGILGTGLATYTPPLRGKPPVIALGTRASDFLKRLEVPHGRVNHPQWWRRFKHHGHKEFAHELAMEFNRYRTELFR